MAKTKPKAIKITGAGGAAMKWFGVPEMRKILGSFATELGPESMGAMRDDVKNILMKPALMIRDEARDWAPSKTGNLRASIFATKGPDSKPGVMVGVNKKQAPYAGYVERGTSRMTAQPYFRPAVVNMRGIVAATIAEDLEKLLYKIADKYGFTVPALPAPK